MRISDWSSDVCSSDLVTVALADKLDTLVGFFVIKERPTGSRDPFALRRAALGIIELVLRNGLRLELDYAASRVGHLIGLQQEKSTSTAVHEIRSEELTSELQSLMRSSYAVFCLQKNKDTKANTHNQNT